MDEGDKAWRTVYHSKDMKDPWVEEYLTEKVIEFLKKYGFEYMKIDYNDTIGIGCDGFESLGEGLRVNIEKTYDFLEKAKREIPGVVLEKCASGGHRLEPRFMAATSMASFSDAHECEEIPIIAANLHRAVLPRQSQIWAVIRQEDSLKRIAYSIAATFLGRMCLSGDVTRLHMDQWNIIEKGMEFYKKISPVIKKGQSHRFGPEVASIRHPEGWQAILRVGEDGDNAYITIHIFDGTLPEIIEVSLPKDCPCYIDDVFSDSKAEIIIEKGILKYRPMENKKAVALYMVRK